MFHRVRLLKDNLRVRKLAALLGRLNEIFCLELHNLHNKPLITVSHVNCVNTTGVREGIESKSNAGMFDPAFSQNDFPRFVLSVNIFCTDKSHLFLHLCVEKAACRCTVMFGFHMGNLQTWAWPQSSAFTKSRCQF